MYNDSKQQSGAVFQMILDTHQESDHVQAQRTTSWEASEQEGQLAVDVAQDDTDVLIVSTLAGAMSDKLEVYVHNDLLTIRGQRQSPLSPNTEFFHQECFWGKFSRTIVLPVDVKGDLAQAEYKNGVLTVRIPKLSVHRKVPITIVED